MTAVWTRSAPDTRCLLSNSRTLQSLIKHCAIAPGQHDTHTRVIELCVSGPISPPWSQSVWRPTALLFLSEGTSSSGCWVFPVQLPDPVWPLPCFSFDTDAQQVEPLKATSWKVLMLDTCAACAKVSPPRSIIYCKFQARPNAPKAIIHIFVEVKRCTPVLET